MGINLMNKASTPSPMRVLHVVGSMNRAGAEVMLMNLYRILDRSKLQFDFLYFTDNACDFDDEIRSLGGQIFILSPNEFRNPLTQMLGLKKLLMANPQIKAVHLHTLLNSAFCLVAAKWANVAVRVTHSHNTADVVNPSFIRRVYQTVAKQVILAYSTSRVACTRDAAEYLFNSAEGVTLLPNGFDLDHTLSESEKNTSMLRTLTEAKADEFILIQVARFNPQKNHRFSIDVLKTLQEKNFGCRLALVGDGSLRQDIQSYAKQQGVADRVFFLGVRTDVPCLLGGADVMLLPSHFEGLGIVLIESQVTGLPAIVSEGVPQEADLGVGLITFLPIDEGPEVWSDHIRSKQYAASTISSNRLQRIRDQGYDVEQNIELLESIYSG